MILSDIEIERLVKDKNLIEKFNKENLQAASYDFCIGNEASLLQKRDNKEPVDLRKKSNINDMFKQISFDTEYILKPTEVIYVKTKEKFNMTEDLIAEVIEKTSVSRIGLFVRKMLLNPNFSGYLHISIQNISPNEIVLYPGMKIGQLKFEKVNTTPSRIKLYNNKLDAAYQDEDIFRGLNATQERKAAVNNAIDRLMKSGNQ